MLCNAVTTTVVEAPGYPDRSRPGDIVSLGSVSYASGSFAYAGTSDSSTDAAAPDKRSYFADADAVVERLHADGIKGERHVVAVA
jgi:hypothetical protein